MPGLGLALALRGGGGCYAYKPRAIQNTAVRGLLMGNSPRASSQLNPQRTFLGTRTRRDPVQSTAAHSRLLLLRLLLLLQGRLLIGRRTSDGGSFHKYCVPWGMGIFGAVLQ